MIYKTLLALYFFILLVRCTIIQENKIQYQAEHKSYGIEIVPFSYVKKLIIVEASLNSNEQRNFIFDTGAFQSKVEYSLAEESNLEEIYSRKNSTAQGITRRIAITSIDSIELSSSKYYNIGAGIIKYSPDSYSQCVAESGIIGSNLIKLSNWKVDYKSKQLTMSETPLCPINNDMVIQLDFKTSYLSGVPLVDIVIEGQVIKNVILDLGYNGGIVVPERFKSKFSSSETNKIVDQSSSGIFGSKRDDINIKYLNLELGNTTTKVPIEFSSLDKALIGNDFLEHFDLYIDYDNEVITLQEISRVEIDKSKVFIPGILNDTLWVVDRVNAEIPLNVGDTLKTVNGYQPKDIFDSNCDYFLNISTLFEEDSIFVKSLDNKLTSIRIE